MDYRKPLFELEQWSPRLARRFWGWTSLLDLPVTVALLLRVIEISDLNAEVEITLPRYYTSTLITAGEFAAKLLWKRYLLTDVEEVFLSAIHGNFSKKPLSRIRVRAQLPEVERERVLRRLRAGHTGEIEMPIVCLDKKKQQVATVHFVFTLRPRGQLSLGAGQGGGDKK